MFGGGGDNIGQTHGGHTNNGGGGDEGRCSGGGGGSRGLGRPWALVWPMKRMLINARTKTKVFVTPFGAILLLNDLCSVRTLVN